MTIGSNQAAAVTAFNRFGLAARPGDLNAAASDPRGFLLEELWSANVALIRRGAFSSAPIALQAYYLEQQQIRAECARIAAAPPAAPTTAADPSGVLYRSARTICGLILVMRPSRDLGRAE